MNGKPEDMIQKIRDHVWKNLSEEQRRNYDRLGEKFHQSFDIEKQHSKDHDIREIALEECLAYLVESIKSGLHPKHTTLEERGLLIGAYGEKWYERFGFVTAELEHEKDASGESILRH